MGDHKNYRFCSCHRVLVLKKPAFLLVLKLKKPVFVTALIYTL